MSNISRVAIILYAASLLMPSVNEIWGLLSVVFGVAALLFDPPWFFVWIANPLFIAAVWMALTDRAPRWRLAMAWLAIPCALYALLATSIVTTDSGGPAEVSLHYGYWVWVAALGLFAVGHTIHTLIELREPAPQVDPA